MDGPHKAKADQDRKEKQSVPVPMWGWTPTNPPNWPVDPLPFDAQAFYDALVKNAPKGGAHAAHS
jgi:hypothetical protein